MKIAVTGHRPDKLGGYTAFDRHDAIIRHMVGVMKSLDVYEENSVKNLDHELIVISGGALGIDQFWIEAALSLKLKVIAALPFKGYNSKWPFHSQDDYKELLDKCYEVRYICEPGYEARKMQIRNEWMVDECDHLYAYWNGTGGGTANCVRYAETVLKPMTIFNTDGILAKN